MLKIKRQLIMVDFYCYVFNSTLIVAYLHFVFIFLDGKQYYQSVEESFNTPPVL